MMRYGVLCLALWVSICAENVVADPEGSPTPSPSPAAVSSIEPEEIEGFEKNAPEVRKLLKSALDLTTQNLTYIYGSDDPAHGGMDCSGTIYYLLQQAGISEAPRSSSEQYVWVRKAGNFHAVVSTHLDSFELDSLKPGDLLFWTGTYASKADPPVTHTMIYLGKAKSDGLPLMVGASDGRSYRGRRQNGVSVFDFTIAKPTGEKPSAARFIGYAEIPW
jgi:cell wall-associated NlpC family hydrolase